ncbi:MULTISPECIES: hypothetical protein [Haloarcula]|uniref:hypothetical protein n=1 Tax=Haloarcula TaxID=2237 RepID=UPI001266EAE3|nr:MULTISPECIES: hypothetical protein [Haloarcula]
MNNIKLVAYVCLAVIVVLLSLVVGTTVYSDMTTGGEGYVVLTLTGNLSTTDDGYQYDGRLLMQGRPSEKDILRDVAIEFGTDPAGQIWRVNLGTMTPPDKTLANISTPLQQKPDYAVIRIGEATKKTQIEVMCIRFGGIGHRHDVGENPCRNPSGANTDIPS